MKDLDIVSITFNIERKHLNEVGDRLLKLLSEVENETKETDQSKLPENPTCKVCGKTIPKGHYLCKQHWLEEQKKEESS